MELSTARAGDKGLIYSKWHAPIPYLLGFWNFRHFDTVGSQKPPRQHDRNASLGPIIPSIPACTMLYRTSPSDIQPIINALMHTNLQTRRKVVWSLFPHLIRPSLHADAFFDGSGPSQRQEHRDSSLEKRTG